MNEAVRPRWDFFISYPSTEEETARALYSLLSPHARTSLSNELEAGEKWPIVLEERLRSSQCTVVLVSDTPTTSHNYYQEEITRAVSLNAATAGIHKVVPVVLSDRVKSLPFGLAIFQALYVGRHGDLSRIAKSLRELICRSAWEGYAGGLFTLEGYRLAYLPLPNASSLDIQQPGAREIEVIRDMTPYVLPKAFEQTAIAAGFSNDPSCRLASYDFSGSHRLVLTFSETSYEAYLKSNEHLDDSIVRGKKDTFRDRFGVLAQDGDSLRPFQLTNITGVGTFVVTNDNKVIVSRHSLQSHVYPGRLTFSASGVMKWGAHPHPAQEAIRKSFEELKHQVNPDKIRLVGFGADARKLYFQLMFEEETRDAAVDIIRRCPPEHELIQLPLEVKSVVEILLSNCWEPAAEAALLTMTAQRHGRDKVVSALKREESRWARKQMVDEWDLRAGQRGLLPVLSVRYPVSRRGSLSESFVDAVMHFIRRDADHKHVLDVGCGIGRLTVKLAKRARKVTAIDLCERMLEKAKEHVANGRGRKNVEFVQGFAQDHESAKRYDVAVCSLVLIHNVEEKDFTQLVAMMCRNSKMIFVFEDVTKNRPTSPHTSLRDSALIEQEFANHGFRVAKRKAFKLSDDSLAFFKFVRPSARRSTKRYRAQA